MRRSEFMMRLNVFPTEIISCILTIFDQYDLEIVITLLDMNFNAIVRYVVDGMAIANLDSKLKTVTLEILDHSWDGALINIVIISDIEALNLQKTLSILALSRIERNFSQDLNDKL
jgi:hypothetical protein